MVSNRKVVNFQKFIKIDSSLLKKSENLDENGMKAVLQKVINDHDWSQKRISLYCT